MIQVSDEFKRLMQERTDFQGYVEARLADGTALTFTADDLAVGGCSVTDGAGASGLPLGAAVCRTVKLELVNPDGHLDGYDFYGAELRVWLTFRLTDSVERVELGTFTVTEPETGGETVTLTAGDAMVRADKLYQPAGGGWTLGELWREVCGQCGIHYDTAVFPNSDLAVPEVEAGQYTCRQMLGYIAMLAGGNARIDRQGTVRILTYDKNRGPDHELDAWSGLSVDTDDVLVTGLELRTEDGTVLEGEEGYVLQVENPLLAGQEPQGLKRMGDILLGLRVRRFDGSHIAYPMAEFMDTVRLTDRRGRTYDTVLTDVTFTFGGYTALANSAEGALRSGSRYVSAETRARVAARQLAERERTAREQAMERMNETLQKASGLYCTAEKQEDDSYIYYLHDKPTLKESTLVMKLTGEAIGLSSDGGKTYPYGFKLTGEMVMGIIRSEGLSADWVDTGKLQSQADKNGERNFVFDLETGEAEVRNLTIRGKNVADTLDETVVSVEQQFYLSSSPTELAGGEWQNTQPAWTAGKYLWTRQKITYSDSPTHVEYAGQYCMTKTVGDIAQQKVDAQTQEDIFNKLTNNGEDQGIFLKDGKVYINLEYLKSNIIDLNVLKLAGTLCGLMQGSGATKMGEITEGIVIYGNGVYEEEDFSKPISEEDRKKIGSAKPPYLIVTNEGFRVQTSESCCFNMARSQFNVLGDITASEVGAYYGSIIAEGNLEARGGYVYVSNKQAVKWDESTTLMKFGDNAYRSWLAGRQTYVGEYVKGYEACVRGETVTLQATYLNESVQPNVTSDKREKKNIEVLPAAYEKLLDGMAPVRFRYKREPDDGPFHMGYIAQDVEAALKAAGLDRGDLAALADIPQEDGEHRLGIAYGELIALLHMKINSLEAEITQLKEAIAK